jgi:hypothetical protein
MNPNTNLMVFVFSFRRQGAAGDEALCTTNCTTDELVTIEPKKCPSISDYPKDLWNNIESQGTDYGVSI